MKTSPQARRHITDLLATHNQSAVARKLGVDTKTVWRWAHNKTIPSGDKLVALAELLRVPAESIDFSGEAA